MPARIPHAIFVLERSKMPLMVIFSGYRRGWPS